MSKENSATLLPPGTKLSYVYDSFGYRKGVCLAIKKADGSLSYGWSVVANKDSTTRKVKLQSTPLYQKSLNRDSPDPHFFEEKLRVAQNKLFVNDGKIQVPKFSKKFGILLALGRAQAGTVQVNVKNRYIIDNDLPMDPELRKTLLDFAVPAPRNS